MSLRRVQGRARLCTVLVSAFVVFAGAGESANLDTGSGTRINKPLMSMKDLRGTKGW